MMMMLDVSGALRNFLTSLIQPNPGNPVPTTEYPVPKPGNKSTHYIMLSQYLPPKEDRRTPLKLPKLEHVALNSATETGAKMHQNAQILGSGP